MEITWRKFYKREALENSFILPQSCVLGASCLACEFYKFPSTTGLDLSNMGDTYHRPDQKTLQALRDMANRLRIHSIESTNTAGSGYVQYAVILMLNFAAWFNSQVAFKLPDFIFQTSVVLLFYGWNNVGSFLPYHALQRWVLVMLLVLPARNHLKPCERDMYWAILSWCLSFEILANITWTLLAAFRSRFGLHSVLFRFYVKFVRLYSEVS